MRTQTTKTQKNTTKQKTENKTNSNKKTTKKSTKESKKTASKLIVTHPIENIPEGGWKSKYNYSEKNLDLLVEEFDKVVADYVNGKLKNYDLISTSDTSKKLVGGDLPTLEKICLKCDISVKYFLEILKDRPEKYSSKIDQLSEAYNRFKDAQKGYLQEGLYLGINTGGAQFLLAANHGMRVTEKVEIESNNTTTINGKIDVYAELDAIYEANRARLEKQKKEMKERKLLLDQLDDDNNEVDE